MRNHEDRGFSAATINSMKAAALGLQVDQYVLEQAAIARGEAVPQVPAGELNGAPHAVAIQVASRLVTDGAEVRIG